ncbi:MAG: HEAT repeat domain-containing protein [Bacteroidaceae bacterium]
MDNNVLYGYDYLSYYFYFLYDKYVAFPFVIQVSVIVIIGSLLIGLFLLFYVMFFLLRKIKERKTMKRLRKKFYETMLRIASDASVYLPEDISTLMNYDKRHSLNVKEKRLFVQMLVSAKIEVGETLNRTNLHNIVVAFDLPHFFERELQFASTKYRLREAMWIRFLEESVSDAVLVRLLYNHNSKLRKAAQATFMWDSKTNPFRFFDDKDFETSFSQWDKIDIHSIFVNRLNLGWGVPSLIQWIDSQNNEMLKKFFVSEIRTLGLSEEGAYLLKVFNSDDSELKSEIAATLGVLKYKEAEARFMEVYSMQPERVKQSILEALTEMNTGRALAFLRDAYTSATDVDTQFAAISALYNYGMRGKRIFERLENKANQVDARLFIHIKDPIINKRIV